MKERDYKILTDEIRQIAARENMNNLPAYEVDLETPVLQCLTEHMRCIQIAEFWYDWEPEDKAAFDPAALEEEQMTRINWIDVYGPGVWHMGDIETLNMFWNLMYWFRDTCRDKDGRFARCWCHGSGGAPGRPCTSPRFRPEQPDRRPRPRR